MANFPFVESPNRYSGRNNTSHRLLFVIHDMEVQDGATTAESVANFFANPTAKASTHFSADLDSVVQSVRVGDTAWAAPGANADGIHFEIAGFKRMSRDEWLADRAALGWAAAAVADVLVSFNRFGIHIPIVKLNTADVLAGKSGLTGHYEVTDAYHLSDHTDPGTGFPWDVFLPLVQWWVGALDKPDYKAKFI